MEGRVMLATDPVTAAVSPVVCKVANQTLYIDGTRGDDWVEIQETATHLIVHSFGAGRAGGSSQSFAKGPIAMIEFVGYSGNDTFINAYEGVVCSIPCRLDGVSGNNTLIGGSGNDWIYSGIGNSILDGGDGDNIVIGGFGANVFYNTGIGSNCFVWMGESNTWAEGNACDGDDACLIFSKFDRSGNSSRTLAYNGVVTPYTTRAWTKAEVFRVVKNVEAIYDAVGTFQFFHTPGRGDGTLYVMILNDNAAIKYGAWYESSWNTITFNGSTHAASLRVLAHEVAHGWYGASANPVWKEFQAVSWNANGTMRSDATSGDFARSYSKTNMNEDWADTVSYVICGLVSSKANATLSQKVAVVHQFFNWLTPQLSTPTNVTVTEQGVSALTVNWTSVAGAAGYDVLRYDSTGKVLLEVVSVAGTDTTAATFTGLDSATKYRFVVRAVAEVDGRVACSAGAKISASTAKFAAVTKVKVAKSFTSVTLTWAPSARPETTGYVVFRLDGKTETEVWSGAGTAATITGLDASTKYTFVIRAVSSELGIQSAAVKKSVKTLKFPATKKPASMKKPLTSTSATLTWKPTALPKGVTGSVTYDVYVSTGPKGLKPDETGWTKIDVPSGDTTITLTGLDAGTTYYVYVRSIWSETPSVYSNSTVLTIKTPLA